MRNVSATPAALIGATIISFSAIFFGLADVTPLTGSFFRMAYALPALAAIAMFAPGDLRPSRSRLLGMLAGVFLGADVTVWHAAIDMVGAGLATLIVNSQVVIVPLVTWALFGERPSTRSLWAMPMVMVGLALITGLGRDDTFGTRPVLGVVLAVAAALFYSAFLVTFRRANRTQGPSVRPLLEATAGAAVVTGLAGWVTGQLDPIPHWPAHGWLLALALGSQVLGWLAIGYALPRLPATHTSFAILLQPTLTLVWGMLIFAEDPSGLQLAGSVLVLLGILVVTVRNGET